LRKVAPGAIALIGLGQSVSGWQSAWIGGAMMIGGGLWIATNVFGPAVLRRLPFEIRVSRRPKLDPLKKPFGGTPDDYAEVAAAALLLANEIAAYADARAVAGGPGITDDNARNTIAVYHEQYRVRALDVFEKAAGWGVISPHYRPRVERPDLNELHEDLPSMLRAIGRRLRPWRAGEPWIPS
jgi:hypothetical protein